MKVNVHLIMQILLFKQYKTFSMFARGVRKIRDSNMQTLDEVEALHNYREFLQPLKCLYQVIQRQEKSFLLLL